jgi:predicted HTH transcriptional regulator
MKSDKFAFKPRTSNHPHIQFPISLSSASLCDLCAFALNLPATKPTSRIKSIEAWGRGIPLILEKAPNVRFSQVAGIFITEFPRPSASKDVESGLESGAQSGAQSEQILKLLKDGPFSANELVSRLRLETKSGAFKRSIMELLNGGLIERTLPHKPNSRLQKYRLTTKGHATLK